MDTLPPLGLQNSLLSLKPPGSELLGGTRVAVTPPWIGAVGPGSVQRVRGAQSCSWAALAACCPLDASAHGDYSRVSWANYRLQGLVLRLNKTSSRQTRRPALGSWEQPFTACCLPARGAEKPRTGLGQPSLPPASPHTLLGPSFAPFPSVGQLQRRLCAQPQPHSYKLVQGKRGEKE